MSYNCVNFDFESTSFPASPPSARDCDESRRECSARAVISRETGSPLVYTLEANYVRGKNINHIQKRYDIMNDQILADEDPHIQDSNSSLYGQTHPEDYQMESPAPEFTPRIWQDVVCSVLYALLDYDGINPISRLIQNKNENLKEAVSKIRKELKAETQRQALKEQYVKK